MSEAQVETPNQGIETLTNYNTVHQQTLALDEIRPQLTEPCQKCKEMQMWTEIFEQYNNYRIMKMREGKENKFEAILKEIITTESASTTTNPRSEINRTQNNQPSGSKNVQSTGVHSSNVEISDTEVEDHPLRASDLRELRNPARPPKRTKLR